MKTKIKVEKEIEISSIRICVPVRRYEDEQIPNDFPLRSGDVWQAIVDIDTGKIKDWPQGKTGDLYLKVCDEGVYTLIDAAGLVMAELDQEYVPHGLIPGEYGDYIHLQIGADGIITNWPKEPDVRRFFQQEEE